MTIDIIAYVQRRLELAEDHRHDLDMQMVVVEAEIGVCRDVLQHCSEPQHDAPSQPDGYKPPPLYYPPVGYPELRPASANVPEQAQAGEAETDPAPNSVTGRILNGSGHESPKTADLGTTPDPAPNTPETATESTAASVSEPRSGRSMPGKDASRTVPQASHADTREAVTDPHCESGETNSGTIGGRQLQPALRTGVASGAVDTHSDHEATGKSAGDAVGTSDAVPAAPRRTIPGSFASILRAYIEEHPDATTADAAKALGVDNRKVSSTAAACKIPVRKLTAEERREAKRQGRLATTAKRHAPQRTQEPPEPTPAPKVPPSTVPPVTAKPEPVAATPAPTRPLPVANGPVRRPSGKLFLLRDSDGLYLGRFCDRMVTDRREAWTGTEAQIFGCRRSFAIARELTELPVTKEQPAARGTM